MRTVRIMCCAVALAAVLAPAVRTQTDPNQYTKMSYMTFSGPVGLPNVTLPAGTYRFQIANPEFGRKVILVSSQDGKNPVGMFLTMPNEQLEPPDWTKPVIMFHETPAGAPEAIRAWFYSGERTGYEFVYPHAQAIRLAKASHQLVLSTRDDTTTATATTTTAKDRYAAIDKIQVDRVDEAGQLTRYEPQPVATAGQSVAAVAPRELPRTASGLQLMQLLSGLSIAAGFGVRKLRQKFTESA